MSRINFNNDWKFCVDYKEEMEQPGFNDGGGGQGGFLGGHLSGFPPPGFGLSSGGGDGGGAQ